MMKTKVKFLGQDMECCGTGVVVGNDYAIGITIVDSEDPDNFLLCLRNPSIKQTSTSQEDYDLIFKVVNDHISRGAINSKRLLENVPEAGGEPSKEDCAFNQ